MWISTGRLAPPGTPSDRHVSAEVVGPPEGCRSRRRIKALSGDIGNHVPAALAGRHCATHDLHPSACCCITSTPRVAPARDLRSAVLPPAHDGRHGGGSDRRAPDSMPGTPAGAPRIPQTTGRAQLAARGRRSGPDRGVRYRVPGARHCSGAVDLPTCRSSLEGVSNAPADPGTRIHGSVQQRTGASHEELSRHLHRYAVCL